MYIFVPTYILVCTLESTNIASIAANIGKYMEENDYLIMI